jgi:hypothetical protein
MNLELGCHLICDIQQIPMIGGATESVFPKTEELLESDGDYWEALSYVSFRKNLDRYVSMMDFLFCELNTLFRKHCFEYYNGRGPDLKGILNEEVIASHDDNLVAALKIAVQYHRNKRKQSWKSFHNRVSDDVHLFVA